jgi:DNA primase
VIWPAEITKLQLAQYYWKAAALAPARRRPALMILRCPSGIGGQSFFQRTPARQSRAASAR